MNKKLFKDFCKFSRLQLVSGDIDPTYPVLKCYYELLGLGREQRLWFTELYTTFYDLGSARAVFDLYPVLAVIKGPLTYPTGIERRGFRGNGLATVHLNDFVNAVRQGSIHKWVVDCLEESPEDSWAKVRAKYQTLKYCGPWASYKFADLMKNVHGYDLSANDIGVGGNSGTAGPIPGMVLLTEENWKRCATDVALQKDLLQRSLDGGTVFSGLDQLETCLCDFNSLVKGRYYSGNDIDAQQEHLLRVKPESPIDESWWEARSNAFNVASLGEHSGWQGVRKNLKTLYRDKGNIYSDLL